MTEGELLITLCKSQKCDILCVQETYRDEANFRQKLLGMNLVIELPHSQYGSAIYTKPELVKSAAFIYNNQIEILSRCTTAQLSPCAIHQISLLPLKNCDTKVVLSDFNIHSTTWGWGYQETNQNAENVETWSEVEGMSMSMIQNFPIL